MNENHLTEIRRQAEQYAIKNYSLYGKDGVLSKAAQGVVTGIFLSGAEAGYKLAEKEIEIIVPKYLTWMIKHGNPDKSFKENWQQFKTENNL